MWEDVRKVNFVQAPQEKLIEKYQLKKKKEKNLTYSGKEIQKILNFLPKTGENEVLPNV